MANAAGDGSISQLRNGRFWVRSPVQPNGKRKALGTYATREEAEEILTTFLCLQGTPGSLPASVVTFGRFAGEVLNLREEDGIRGIDKERDRYRFHLADCLLSDMPLSDIRPQHIAELARVLMRKDASDKRGKRKISRKTVQRCLAIVSSVCSEAVERGLMPTNPCIGIKAKRRADEAANESFEYANPDEQQKLATCAEIPLVDRLVIRFAIGTGIREGELCHNLLSDLHVLDVKGDLLEEPFLFVRYGSKNRPPKSGKTRRVPLFGDALAAIVEYLELLKGGMVATCNPDGIIFPTKRGCRRQSGKPLGNGRKVRDATDPRGWSWEGRFEALCRVAGVTKHLRWHDLRHTCASSLVAGWWGRKWPLEEIKELLGHSSIVVTQIYAHLGETSLKSAAKETNAGYALVTRLSGGCSAMANIRNDSEEVGRAGVEPATYGLKGAKSTQKFRVIEGDGSPSEAPLVTTLAATVLELLRAGQKEAALAVAVSLASAALAGEANSELPSRTA